VTTSTGGKGKRGGKGRKRKERKVLNPPQSKFSGYVAVQKMLKEFSSVSWNEQFSLQCFDTVAWA